MATKTKTKLRAVDVKRALHKKFAGDAVAFFDEVRNKTGFRGSRETYADGISMELWPSRGFEITGYEIKVARSDWLNELKDPGKAEPIFRFCNRWYLVTANDVAKLDEIPAAWGWMHWTGKKMLTRKKSPASDPMPLEKGFIASLLRSANRKSDGDMAELVAADAVKKAHEEGFAEGKRKGRGDSFKGECWAELAEKLEEQGVNLKYYSVGANARLLAAACKMLGDLQGTKSLREMVIRDLTASVSHRRAQAAVKTQEADEAAELLAQLLKPLEETE